jgi:TolB-like protein
MASVWGELKRRNVVRVAIAYAVVAWLLLQVADVVLGNIGAPTWVFQAILLLLIIGLPLALILAWAFEFTSEGIRKETEIDRPESTSVAASNRKLNVLIIAALAIAVVFLLVDRARMGVGRDDSAISTAQTAARSAGPKVAVLPFDNLSGDSTQDYFSDGLSEDISNALSRFRDIRVIPASLTMAYRNTAELGAVGDELGAAYVIGGSVRLTPEAIRISARLIDVSSSTQLWGETYDRELSAANLFDIQSDVAQRVVTAIADSSGVLSRVGQHRLVSQTTDSLEAYGCVLRGYAYLTIHTAETHLAARECLERAVQLDPEYADAWAHLGYIYREEDQHNRNLELNALERALSASQRAIELDGSNPMARFAMSLTKFSLGDINAGMSEAEKMISLNPNDASKVAGMGYHFVGAGYVDRGVELVSRAESLIATSSSPPIWLPGAYASAHYQSGEYSQVIEELSRWDAVGNDVQWHILKAAALGQMGKTSEANRELDRINELFPAFAEDPIRELRKFLFTEDVVRKYYDGLKKAGLQAELVERA